MYQLEWANKEVWQTQPSILPEANSIDKRNISKVLMMGWEEHCVECAVPECYASCPLYEKRRDGGCARFVYGIVPNGNYRGHFNFGADVRFRKWGKLEANLSLAFPTPVMGHYWLGLYNKLSPNLKSTIRKKFNEMYGAGANDFDAFLIECHSPHAEPYQLMIEYFVQPGRTRKTLFRDSFTIHQGYNFYAIPFEKFNITAWRGYLYVYPEEGATEKRLIFTWLDFVKYKNAGIKPALPLPDRNKNKIKCVVWDLDNTLWQGTLAESPSVEPKSEVLDLIVRLDERGILQSICSKNNFEPAWRELERLGISEYFLHPAINWGQKSENIAEIARKLNIGLDTFALIDDSAWERTEVAKALPQVRTYSELEIARLLEHEEFDVPVTSASKARRNSYKSEIVRNIHKAKFSANYEEFLLSCNMEMVLFHPTAEDDVLRCWELVQRSNQLNISGKRYSQDDFKTLLADEHALAIGIKCRDRFGDYGTIGFVRIDLSGETPAITDFVLSCRVAQKKVEHAFLKEISKQLSDLGYQELDVCFLKTGKNIPLLLTFKELPCKVTKHFDAFESMRLTCNSLRGLRDIIQVQSEILPDRIAKS